MAQKLRIGYFKHWFQPPYSFVSFLEEQGIAIEKIENSLKGYLEKYDVAIVEQHGFNDFVTGSAVEVFCFLCTRTICVGHRISCRTSWVIRT